MQTNFLMPSHVQTMSDFRNPFNYPINPEFGKGVYRRRIRLSNDGNITHGELEDCNHGFSVTVTHDDNLVTDINANAGRIPFTTCAGANTVLQTLVGTRIDLSAKALAESVNPSSHCTHWLDLTLLAIRHSFRGEGIRIYDIEVPDEAFGAVNAKLYRNHQLIFEWQVQDWTIQAPSQYKDNTLFKGFSSWANNIADADEQEAAFVMQKGYFVSRARRFDIDSIAGERANQHGMMKGACYTYSEPQVDIAERTKGTVRDFTHSPEQLLKFQ